jgi:hypothetical protein
LQHLTANCQLPTANRQRKRLAATSHEKDILRHHPTPAHSPLLLLGFLYA